MHRLLFLLLLLSGGMLAQPDNGFREYSEGDYGSLPFPYTSVLMLEQVRELVRHISSVTDGEIEGIYYRSPELRVGGDEIYVHVCAKGIRAVRRCDGGSNYRFVREGNGWVRKKDVQVGIWRY